VTTSPQPADVVVVGGGIIGRSVASSAARRGLSVIVVEPAGATFGTSSANAGHLVPSHVVAFAAPGMVRAGLRSLALRDGAFAISPRSAVGLVPWLWRFAQSSTATNVSRGVPALRWMLDTTIDEIGRLRDEGFALDHAHGGIMQVAGNATSLRALHQEAEEWGHWGVRTQAFDQAGLRGREPMLNERAVGGVLLADDERIDPALLLAAITDDGVRHGVLTVAAAVDRIEAAGAGARVHTPAGVIEGARVVIAAGVWTPALCRSSGVRLSIVAARGNSVTLPDVPLPNGPMLLVEQRLALSPLAQGLRLTSGFRLTHTADRAVNPARSREIIRRAGEVLSLPPDTVPANEWTGLRPATPDGLPIIGALPGAPAILVAAGHGMLGSSCSLGTGEAVASLLTGGEPGFDMAVVSPARFIRKGSVR
jgi:D-amino-acid dehydrogenase